MKIICLGPEGTYSHHATLQYDSHAEITFVKTISEGFEIMSQGKHDALIVPAENMIHGTVRETLDNLYDYPFKISNSITLPIKHALMAPSKTINTIYSHPQALNQCRKYLQKKYPTCELIATTSTAQACKKAMRSKNAGAIAHKSNSVLFPKLQIIADNIQDFSKNKTLFFVISDSYNLINQKHTATIIVPHADASGLLFNILKEFKKGRINLTKLESRPQRSNLGSYMFFIDFQGDFREKSIAKTLTKIAKLAAVKQVKILGSY